MTLIYAFDPGVMTGIAVWDTETETFYADQLGVEDLYTYVDSVCNQIGRAQIEKFTITQATIKKARESAPLDVIGYLKYCAWRCDFDVGWTKPADVMDAFPNAALKKGQMYTVGKEHANDAARHLAWTLVRSKIKPAGDFLL